MDSLDAYQVQAKTTAIYPEDIARAYLAMGLAGEAGEVANKIKKLYRDGSVQGIGDELGDVLWYLAVLAHECGFWLSDIADENLWKLEDRKTRGTLRGSGDTR